MLPQSEKLIMPLAMIYKVLSYAAASLAMLDGALIVYDGIMGQLELYYRVVTCVVALVFLAGGAVVAGLERSLTRIRKYGRSGSRQNHEVELTAEWRIVYLSLTAIIGVIFVVMCLATIAIIGRMQEGYTIFG